MKNKYNHINDCWQAIRKVKTLEEIKELFKEFPRWSGDWDIVLNPFNKPKGYYVVNYHYDSVTEIYEEDFEYLNIEIKES